MKLFLLLACLDVGEWDDMPPPRQSPDFDIPAPVVVTAPVYHQPTVIYHQPSVYQPTVIYHQPPVYQTPVVYYGHSYPTRVYYPAYQSQGECPGGVCPIR